METLPDRDVIDVCSIGDCINSVLWWTVSDGKWCVSIIVSVIVACCILRRQPTDTPGSVVVRVSSLAHTYRHVCENRAVSIRLGGALIPTYACAIRRNDTHCVCPSASGARLCYLPRHVNGDGWMSGWWLSLRPSVCLTICVRVCVCVASIVLSARFNRPPWSFSRSARWRRENDRGARLVVRRLNGIERPWSGAHWLSEWENRVERVPQTHYRSFLRRVFPVSRLHWYWQPNLDQPTDRTQLNTQ